MSDPARAAVARFLAATPGARIAVAVSGGSDSTALLLAAMDAGATPRAVTVDHGLRPESADEARAVGALCDRLGLTHDVLSLDLATGPNLQARAREARLAALSDWGAAAGLDGILLGHTADDVAETLILRLRRGAGIDGLARMAARRPSGRPPLWFGRPFLDLTRETLRTGLSARGIDWIDDPSNADPAFDRAAVRGAIRALDLDVETLAASAAALDDTRRTLDHDLAAFADRIARSDRGDLLIEVAPLVAAMSEAPDHARRLLVAGLRWIGGGGYPPRRAEQAALLGAVAAGRSGTLAGCRYDLSDGLLRLSREASACAPPGPTDRVWDGRWRIDGPHAPDLTVGALGAAVADLPWRETGLPRASLLASPAIRRGDTLVAAPLAGRAEGWTATPRVAFAQAVISR